VFVDTLFQRELCRILKIENIKCTIWVDLLRFWTKNDEVLRVTWGAKCNKSQLFCRTQYWPYTFVSPSSGVGARWKLSLSIMTPYLDILTHQRPSHYHITAIFTFLHFTQNFKNGLVAFWKTPLQFSSLSQHSNYQMPWINSSFEVVECLMNFSTYKLW